MRPAKWIPVLMLLFAPLITAAQMPADQQITAQVPFAFTVGNMPVPAGEWTVQGAHENGWILTLRNRDAKLSRFILASPAHDKNLTEPSALVFSKYGDRYFLSSIKLGDSTSAYDFRPGKLEMEMRAQNIPATQEILLASFK